MYATLAFVIAVVWLFAALGRGSTPPAERVPWTRWTPRDLLANVLRGGRRLLELDERSPRASRRRTPFHG